MHSHHKTAVNYFCMRVMTIIINAVAAVLFPATLDLVLS